MFIDFRYHVITIISILVALGLGILIGSTIVGENIVSGIVIEQQNWIERLEEDFINFKREISKINQELQTTTGEIGFYEELFKKTKPYLINDKLLDKRYGVITIGEKKQEVIEILRDSGANIIWNIKVTDIYNEIRDILEKEVNNTEPLDGIIIVNYTELETAEELKLKTNLQIPIYVIGKKILISNSKNIIFSVEKLDSIVEQVSFILTLLENNNIE